MNLQKYDPFSFLIEGFEKPGLLVIPNAFGKRNFITASILVICEDFKISITQILIKRTVLQSSLVNRS